MSVKIFLKINNLLFAILLFSHIAKAQYDSPNPPANIVTVTSGSFVIAMDNTNQALNSSNVFVSDYFNLKAYGLLNALLQNDIPVRWIINAAKAKDGIDFTALATREYPTSIIANILNFKGSAFIIDTQYVDKPFFQGGQSARQVIISFGNNVAVYKLMTNTTVDQRYLLNKRPKVAVFNNGGNQYIHTKMLDLAGIPNYESISAGVFTGLSQCFTFCSEPHWNSSNQSDTAITNRVREFVFSGGNFLAQCAGLLTYENLSKMQSTNGISNYNSYVMNLYYNTNLAFMQINGNVAANQSGYCKNWVNGSGSLVAGFYPTITNLFYVQNYIASGAHLIANNLNGGNVFYLGGHDYLNSSYSYSDIEKLNAVRLYLNAVFIPSNRPTPFIVSAGTNTTICKCGSVTLGNNNNPTGISYYWNPATGLDNPNSPNPIASPTSTTTYTLLGDNGGCTATSTVTISVWPQPIGQSNSQEICIGSPVPIGGSPTASGGTPPYSYLWIPSNGLNFNNVANPLANPTVNTTYKLIITDANGCKSDTISTDVLVFPTPNTSPIVPK